MHSALVEHQKIREFSFSPTVEDMMRMGKPREGDGWLETFNLKVDTKVGGA